MHTCMHTHIRIHISMHEHIHVHIYTYRYICACTLVIVYQELETQVLQLGLEVLGRCVSSCHVAHEKGALSNTALDSARLCLMLAWRRFANVSPANPARGTHAGPRAQKFGGRVCKETFLRGS